MFRGGPYGYQGIRIVSGLSALFCGDSKAQLRNGESAFKIPDFSTENACFTPFRNFGTYLRFQSLIYRVITISGRLRERYRRARRGPSFSPDHDSVIGDFILAGPPLGG